MQRTKNKTIGTKMRLNELLIKILIYNSKTATSKRQKLDSMTLAGLLQYFA